MRFASLLPYRCFFPTGRINASWRAAAFSFLSSTGPVARNGLSLTRNNDRFHGHHSGVNAPDLLLRSLARSLPGPFGFQLHYRFRFAPVPAASSLRPVACWLPRSRGSASGLHSPSGFLLPPDQSVLPNSGRSVRLPVAPDAFRSPLPSLLLVWETDHRSGTLRFRRLAVPQTSWNLPHYALIDLFRQPLLRAEAPVFIRIYLVSIQPLASTVRCRSCG